MKNSLSILADFPNDDFWSINSTENKSTDEFWSMYRKRHVTLCTFIGIMILGFFFEKKKTFALYGKFFSRKMRKPNGNSPIIRTTLCTPRNAWANRPRHWPRELLYCRDHGAALWEENVTASRSFRDLFICQSQDRKTAWRGYWALLFLHVYVRGIMSFLDFRNIWKTRVKFYMAIKLRGFIRAPICN